jgi:type IV pilus assembly protein PilY1
MKLSSRILGYATIFAMFSLSNFGAASAALLADQPVFATSDVPGNLALALSVEFPTAISVANLGDYADASEYLGYFDPKKCYSYELNTANPSQSFFSSVALATGASAHQCNGKWSGNFMNWATMQTIDPFRWALSGGYRSVDGPTSTILEKAWGSNQGGDSNFPRRGTSQGGGHQLLGALVSKVTPFSGNVLNTRVYARGNRMVFGIDGNEYNDEAQAQDFGSGSGTNGTDGKDKDGNNCDGNNGKGNDGKADKKCSTFQVYVRVKVCDPAANGGLEANCVAYGNSYKPEGLLQKYSNKIRYSTFAFLNAGGDNQQGAVMRAQMGFIGPTYPQPLSATVTINPRAEWDANTGVMAVNPDSALATGSGVADSGVMNYLNKFGQSAKTYMTYDNVSELYYTALRYFENLGNVTEWTNTLNATKLDGFPAPTSWAGMDPISYSCQKNFILGIGDNNTHYDVNVGGGTLTNSRAKPAAVVADTQNQAQTWTRNLETLEGLTSRNSSWGSAGSEYIAGLAYGAHVTDIRPDIVGIQNISTYWMDVMEYERALYKNPYWLAAKYGGFSAPTAYDINNTTTPLTQNWWNTTGNTIDMNGTREVRPDNYFLAGNARQMVDGLTAAFSNIANAIKAFTTSFSLSTAQISSSGAASYASQYDSKGWTGVITASTITFASNGTPSSSVNWATSNTMESQLAGSGWDTGRNVVTWRPDTSQGTPFRRGTGITGVNGISQAQRIALDTLYVPGNDRVNYLNYLRGDRTNEVNSTVTGSTKSFRTRTLLLGDIVNSKVTPVAAPQQPFSNALNPGYASFKTTWANRPTMVYVGANDGMLHAFNGSLTGASAGTEAFAFIPNAVFSGPDDPVSTKTDELSELGNPAYSHRYYVDATAVAFDIDFNYAGGTKTTTTAANSDWRSILIGGLGKGGKSFYAIDITNPAGMNTEATVASKVLWEVSVPTNMGYSFGTPTVVKTKKYGWVIALTSGYNNGNDIGYLYFINPSNGAVLETVSTGTTAPGMTHASAYVQDFTDGTSDAIYVGDLNGQLWRFDLTATTGSYPSPIKLAVVTDSAGNAQPITTSPLIEIQPNTKKRFVMFGTGKLLDSTDITSAREQGFYAILDGNSTAFRAAVTSPVVRAGLMPVTNSTTGVTLSDTSMGWYIDLGTGSGIGWRLVNNPTATDGIVAFASMLTTGDACSPSGVSRVYAIDFNNGTSTLTDTTAGFASFSSSITDLRFISVDGRVRLVIGNTRGELDKVNYRSPPGVGLRVLNWREVPTVD